jgi:hypothetical protein
MNFQFNASRKSDDFLSYDREGMNSGEVGRVGLLTMLGRGSIESAVEPQFLPEVNPVTGEWN